MSRKQGKYIFKSDLAETKDISPNIRISVVTTLREFKDFYQVPWVVYQNDANWIPPFWMEFRNFFHKKNPFWKHAKTRLFIARRNKTNVGRIAAFIDHKHCKVRGEKVGYFGFFECIHDFKIASALFHVAQKWLASKGISLMRGPINGRVDVGCGFLYEGFNSHPSILSSYSPKYYLDFAKRYGMKKARDQLIYHVDLKKPISDSVTRAAKFCEAKGVKIRGFNRLRANNEKERWIELLLETFSDHWGYVPVSADEVKSRFGVNHLRWFVDSRLFLVAEIDNQPIAFIWSTPDYNQVFKEMNGRLRILKYIWNRRKINQGKFHLIGIKKEYRKQGIGSLLNYYSILEMKRRGYIDAECGWIDEKNIASQRTIEKTGAKLRKKFRVYEKEI